MREKDQPQFHIEGFSEDPQIRNKQMEELIKKRDEILKKLQEDRKKKETRK